MAFGGPAEVLKLVQAERPMLAIDEDEIEVELPQNVDHPWGGEGKVVAVRLAAGTHGGFDSVGLLHRMSSCVGRLTNAGTFALPLTCPQFLGCHPRAFNQRFELRPLHRRVTAHDVIALSEAAVGARDDVLAPDDASEILDAPGD